MELSGIAWSPEEVQRRQAFRLMKGKRTQEESVQDTEDTRIGADPNRQSDHGERCMKRAPAPNAYSMSRVLGDLARELLGPGAHEVQHRARPEANKI